MGRLTKYSPRTRSRILVIRDRIFKAMRQERMAILAGSYPRTEEVSGTWFSIATIYRYFLGRIDGTPEEKKPDEMRLAMLEVLHSDAVAVHQRWHRLKQQPEQTPEKEGEYRDSHVALR
ncbi:unnamed protein product [Amoebophrya sp. A25]|nr:unnamed protein product [Amoebophrya sp. A25]|eukprot:GSA25T00024574001.1